MFTGTHIPIKAPVIDPDTYINRKRFHSLNVQVVSSAAGLTISYCARFQGKLESDHIKVKFSKIPINMCKTSWTFVSDLQGLHMTPLSGTTRLCTGGLQQENLAITYC